MLLPNEDSRGLVLVGGPGIPHRHGQVEEVSSVDGRAWKIEPNRGERLLVPATRDRLVPAGAYDLLGARRRGGCFGRVQLDFGYRPSKMYEYASVKRRRENVAADRPNSLRRIDVDRVQ